MRSVLMNSYFGTLLAPFSLILNVHQFFSCLVLAFPLFADIPEDRVCSSFKRVSGYFCLRVGFRQFHRLKSVCRNCVVVHHWAFKGSRASCGPVSIGEHRYELHRGIARQGSGGALYCPWTGTHTAGGRFQSGDGCFGDFRIQSQCRHLRPETGRVQNDPECQERGDSGGSS
jgi:hypothetical protein